MRIRARLLACQAAALRGRVFFPCFSPPLVTPSLLTRFTEFFLKAGVHLAASLIPRGTGPVESWPAWDGRGEQRDTSVTERLDYADRARNNGKRTEIPVSVNYRKIWAIWEDRPIKREYSVCQFSSNHPFQGSNTGSNPVGDTNPASLPLDSRLAVLVFSFR